MFAELPGARIWYEESGSGAPVVLLHSRTGSTALWSHQLPAFAKAGYRCIAYDRRGQGRSEAGAQGHPASDLESLLDKLGVARCHLVGTAAGGFVAFDFALSHPDRVLSMVVANSIGGVQDEDYAALQRRLRPSPQFDALPPEIRELGPAYRAANPEGVKRWAELEHAAGADATKKTPATRNRITFKLLESLKVRTLLITGDADLYVPPPVLELFRQRIPGATSVIIPGSGHTACWEQPELFNRAVLDFLSGGGAS